MRSYLLIICFLLSGRLFASESLLQEANKLYKNDSFLAATALYDSLLAKGFESADLFYNLGNAHYKSGNLGKAILFYEKTLKLNPGHGDAQYNLDLARQQVTQVESVPEFFLIRVWKQLRDLLSSKSWMWIAILLAWLTLAAGLVFLFGKRFSYRQGAFWIGIIVFMLSILAFTLAGSRHSAELDDSMAIMTQTNFFVKSAPGEGSSDLFQIREGVKVKILDEVDGWYRIRLSDGKDGWLPMEQVERI